MTIGDTFYMLDLRGAVARSRAARLAFVAALIFCASVFACWLVSAPVARAATGELLEFGEWGWDVSSSQFDGAGPVAIDPSDNSFYVADIDRSSGTQVPRLRKFA